jgi:sucrose-6-phosphate hydrolase SacC (GH32 family)
MPSETQYCTPVRTGLGLLLTAIMLFVAQVFAQPSESAPATHTTTASWQPQIHFSSPGHWINDRNGPIFINGQYTFFPVEPFRRTMG